MLPNIEKLPVKDLIALQGKIKERLPEAKRELIIELRKKVDDLAEPYGLTAKDIINSGRGRPLGSKNKPAVRRGRPPGKKNLTRKAKAV